MHLPDPVADALKGLSERIRGLEDQIAELTGAKRKNAEVRPLRRGEGHDPASG
jgi:serine O-acetyltransferase